MYMKKLKIGVIGMGFAGALHIDAIRRIGSAELVAVADQQLGLARQKAEEYGIEKYYNTIDDMIAENQLDAVHNCTPNFLHREINGKVIEHGIHLFSEKPLARTAEEAQAIVDVLKKYPKVVTGVNHCYRMNPMVQEMRRMLRDGAIGTPRLVHGSYLQDHLLYETDYSWRIDPEINGPSRAMADIGTHWMDTVQYVIGSRITEVCADLVTVMPKRKKPLLQVASFEKNTSTEFEEIDITNEDFGSVLFKMENGIHGVFYVSQVSPGHGCFLNFEIDGSKASFYWNQEKPNRVWLGHKDEANRELDRNPVSMAEHSRKYTHLAKGHPEGWNDALRNTVSSFYQFILDGKKYPGDRPDFTTFDEALYLLKLLDAILKSSTGRQWVTVD
jgi:predicted dehydrogenase